MAAFWEAFKGAQVELQACSSASERLVTAFRISRILVSELGVALSLIPYGFRAWRLYSSLPSLEQSSSGKPQHGVLIAKDIRYGPKERNSLDLYIPTNGHAYPVALFCHGGVWATGEKWHYAPMAVRLAQSGIMTAIVSYTLYPKAQAADMVAELGAALTWTLDNAASYGGSPSQVSALGHSAGAQLLALVLLHRARAARRSSCRSTAADPAGAAAGEPHSDLRMPARFIGMAGVYDIAKHYEYEAGRGVQYLSTMERAMGGRAGFPAASPTAILARAAPCQPASTEAARTSRLRGEAIAERVGFHRGVATGVAAGPSVARAPAAPEQAPTCQQRADSPADGSCPPPTVLDFSLGDAARLPPFYLLSSLPDVTVPWYESAEMFWRLRDCGVRAQHLVYCRESHADFATAWRPLPEALRQTGDHCHHDLHDSATDVVALLTGGGPEEGVELASDPAED